MANIVKNIGTSTGSAGTGTVTATGTTAVVGVLTLFTTEMKDASGFPFTMLVSGTLYNVASITDDTHLTLTTSATFTAVSYTIGARNFSTVQAWEDQLPANLVTNGNSQEGRCWNDSEFSVAATTTFSGSTTSATFFILLTTAAGQSFRDNASVQTNPLAYDATKGVGLKNTAGYSIAISVGEDFVSITNMQVRAAGGGTTGSAIESTTALTANSTVAMLKNNILESNVGTSGRVLKWGGGQVINNVIIQRGTASLGVRTDGNAATFLNNTIVRTNNNAKSGTGIEVAYAAVTIKNNAIFNFTSDTTAGGGGSSTRTTNYTDATTPSSGFTAATMTNQFVVSTDTGRDYRLKTGADCIDTGTTDSTASPDIAGTTRPSGTAYDVGAWEFVAPATGVTPMDNQAFTQFN